MIELKTDKQSNVVEVKISGRLGRQGYLEFVPELERLIEQHDKVRLLVEMEDFHGWGAGALWEDTKFAVRHFRDIDRLAMVGEKKWQKGMAVFCKPFTTAEIRYFEKGELNSAKKWLAETL